MPLPTGYSVRVNAIRMHLDAAGATKVAHVDYALLDANGNQVGGGTHSLPARQPGTMDTFTGDGTTTAFTTKAAPFGGKLTAVRLNGTVQTTGFTTATNSDGTITVTFATAPSSGDPKATPPVPPDEVQLVYPTGPGLDDPSCDLAATLGLASGSGTVYAGNSHTSAHQHVGDVNSVLAAWGAARVAADKFS